MKMLGNLTLPLASCALQTFLPPAQLSLTWSSAATRESPSYNLGLRTLQLEQNLKEHLSNLEKPR